MTRPVRPVPSSFGPLLRQLRDDAGLAQNQLAIDAGLDHSQISRYESGERAPTPDTLDVICGALGLTASQRVRLFAAAGIWPFDGVPSAGDALRITRMMGARA